VPRPGARPAGSARITGEGARARIVDAALRLFPDRGITATGVAELAEAAHVSKRTLYQHFPHKDEIVFQYLRELEAAPRLTAEGALQDEALTPRARLLELFTALAERPRRGCPFLAVVAERPNPRDPARHLVAAHKQRFAEQLADLARGAGARSPDSLGRQLALLYDGAAIRGQVENSPEPAQEAFRIATTLLNAATA
jgi:AcrR family transcriptional regulator